MIVLIGGWCWSLKRNNSSLRRLASKNLTSKSKSSYTCSLSIWSTLVNKQIYYTVKSQTCTN